VKLKIVWIGRTKEPAIQSLAAEYSKRISRYVQMESQEFASEEAFLKWIDKVTPRPLFIALDSRGKQFSSEELAQFIGNHQDRGSQAMLFAIGPPNGWSEPALKAAQFQLSMGKLTLPHELALVVLLEQIYRAYTILKGHPYHVGH
jgi:23S rRNA (pseudouridine1915-N3)-methyltransferase